MALHQIIARLRCPTSPADVSVSGCGRGADRTRVVAGNTLVRWASSAFLAIASVAASPAAVADGIEPGLWKITETVVMNGAASPPQVKDRCLSAAQAGDTAKTFSPDYFTVNSGCERTEFLSTATKLKWRMECKGQMDMDVAGDFTFDTASHYTATISSKGSMAGRVVVDASVAIEGEQIGECR